MDIDADVFVLSKRDRTIPQELRQVKNLRLRIWKSGLERFEELASYPNVTELEIMDYRSRSFAPLGALRDLRRLSVIHFPPYLPSPSSTRRRPICVSSWRMRGMGGRSLAMKVHCASSPPATSTRCDGSVTSSE